MVNYNQTSSFNTQLAREIGINAALVFDELSFWSPKSQNDGWVYKTYEEMSERLPLSKKQLKKAYDILIEKGLAEKKVARVSGVPKVHLKLTKNLGAPSDLRELSESDKRELSESDKRELSLYTATNNSNYYKKINKKNENLEKTNNEINKFDTELFVSLVAELGCVRATATPGRKAKLAKRLKTYTPEELKKAARNIGKNKFMSGENDNKKRYGTIDYLLRNDEKIEEWLDVKEESIFG